uniref:Uncharacterized protein n=1 Tax=viral metagenome TaxID=1070528 RepID=A0A6M3LFL1_9ZZZZ
MAVVTEDLTEPRDVLDSKMEIVQFDTSSNGDTYAFKRLAQIDAIFTSQITTDSIETGASFTTLDNGQVRATLVLSATCSGYLVAIGRL